MIALFGFDRLDGVSNPEPRTWLSALIASLFVAGAVYGREKITARNGNEPPSGGSSA